MNFNELIQERNIWLLIGFIFYFIIIVFFSMFYYVIYRRCPRHFVFGRNILEAQRENMRESARAKLPQINQEIAVFSELLSQLQSGKEVFQTTSSNAIATLASGYRVTMYHIDEGGFTSPGLSIEKLSGEKIRNGYLYGDKCWSFPETDEDFVAIVSDQMRILKKRQKKYSDRLDTLGSDYPDVWTYWDFLYFSTMTQTTVGYGDILPNSTLVRSCVVGQVFLGYAIIIVLINLILTG